MSDILQPAFCQTPCYKQPGVQLYAEDCLETLRRMSTGSIDLFLQDTPFGCTQNEWDIKPNFEIMWQEWERVTKENAAMIFFGTQPFASELIVSNQRLFKYDLIWDKSQATGFLNANKMPLRNHETILIFYKKPPTYNPLKTKGKKQLKSTGGKTSNYSKFDYKPHYSEDYFPKSIITEYPQIREENGHPTQKPLNLIRYLIKTYTNENETVFDGYSGSGTTAAACLKENRQFIGSELSKEYFEMSVKRLDEIIRQPELFR